MKFLGLLKKLTSHSTHHQHKVACIIAKGNRVVSIGFNKVKTHTQSHTLSNGIHAETAALLRSQCSDLSGATAYIYRETKNGELGLARPCEACMSALQRAGISDIIYTIKDGIAQEAI